MTGNQIIEEINSKKEDYRESVIEVQNYLRILYKSGYDIEQVAPDGIYGIKTRDAVSEFQNIVGLPITGIVDVFTWDALREEYISALRSDGSPIYPFGSGLCSGKISYGDNCDLVYIVQVMLNTISLNYSLIDPVEINGIYNEETAEAIKIFQELNGLDRNGEVDAATWNTLADTYNSYKRDRGRMF